MLLVKNPPRIILNANPPHSLFNSFRKLPKVLRPATLNTCKHVNQKKPQLILRPSLPLPRNTVKDDKFSSSKQENINPLHNRMKRKISPRSRRKQNPLAMKMPNLIPSGSVYLNQNERKRARTGNPLARPNKVQIIGATARTAFARKQLNIESAPPSLMNPNIVVAQASKPKQAVFRMPQFAKVETHFPKSIPTLKACSPESMSIVEDLTFFLDRKRPRQLKHSEVCPNAPDSDDECERDYELVDATLAHDFGGQDEIIVGHNPLRKKCRYLGVSWNTQHVKWIAQVGYRGKRHYVGQFLDCRRAAMAIDAFCIDLGIAPRNRSRLACRGKKKSLNPNWQTRGERQFRTRNYYD